MAHASRRAGRPPPGAGRGRPRALRATVRGLLERGAGEVVFLGDLFRVLVGFPRFWDEVVRVRASPSSAALRGAGVRVVLVEGNRDFFLDAAALEPFRDAWARCTPSPPAGAASCSSTATSSTGATAPTALWRRALEERRRRASGRACCRAVWRGGS